MMGIDSITPKANSQVSPYSLAILRIAFGTIGFITIIRYFLYGWIDEYFIKPDFFFKHYGMEWITLPPDPYIVFIFYSMLLFSFLIVIGVFSRISLFIFSFLFTWMHFSSATIFLNHYYFIGLLGFLLSISPTSKVLSWDSFQKNGKVNSKSHSENYISLYWIWLFRFQFGMVYFFGGLAKLKSDWLLDALPLRLWLSATDVFWLPEAIKTLLILPITAYAMSWMGFIFDITIPFLLLFNKTRWKAWGLVFIFHVLTSILLPIGIFPLAMIFGSTIFFQPNWPKKFYCRFFSGNKNKTIITIQHSIPFSNNEKYLLLPALIIYIIFMIFLPIRHLIYPGNVLWTEEGFNFSWHVMIAEKNGSSNFRISGYQLDNNGNQIQFIEEDNPRKTLTSYQYKMMSISPDQILQYAKILEKKYKNKYPNSKIEIFVESNVSLNGRPAKPLYSPEQNLLLVPRSWKHNKHILSEHNNFFKI